MEPKSLYSLTSSILRTAPPANSLIHMACTSTLLIMWCIYPLMHALTCFVFAGAEGARVMEPEALQGFAPLIQRFMVSQGFVEPTPIQVCVRQCGGGWACACLRACAHACLCLCGAYASAICPDLILPEQRGATHSSKCTAVLNLYVLLRSLWMHFVLNTVSVNSYY